MSTKIVTKQGNASWADLKGKWVEFWLPEPWEDDLWDYRGIFSHTEVYWEDPRYPRYFIMFEDGSGRSVWESESVEVHVYDEPPAYADLSYRNED